MAMVYSLFYNRSSVECFSLLRVGSLKLCDVAEAYTIAQKTLPYVKTGYSRDTDLFFRLISWINYVTTRTKITSGSIAFQGVELGMPDLSCWKYLQVQHVDFVLPDNRLLHHYEEMVRSVSSPYGIRTKYCDVVNNPWFDLKPMTYDFMNLGMALGDASKDMDMCARFIDVYCQHIRQGGYVSVMLFDVSKVLHNYENRRPQVLSIKFINSDEAILATKWQTGNIVSPRITVAIGAFEHQTNLLQHNDVIRLLEDYGFSLVCNDSYDNIQKLYCKSVTASVPSLIRHPNVLPIDVANSLEYCRVVIMKRVKLEAKLSFSMNLCRRFIGVFSNTEYNGGEVKMATVVVPPPRIECSISTSNDGNGRNSFVHCSGDSPPVVVAQSVVRRDIEVPDIASVIVHAVKQCQKKKSVKVKKPKPKPRPWEKRGKQGKKKR